MKELPYKGFILPDGRILEPQDSLSHESIAFNYIKKHGFYDHYRKSDHSSAQDYLVFELNAMQVRTAGQQILVLLYKNYNFFSRYIDEYQAEDNRWGVQLLTG